MVIEPAPYTANDRVRGEQALNTGNNGMAVIIFQGIVDALGDTATAEDYQNLGIALRKEGDRYGGDLYKKAEDAFVEADRRSRGDGLLLGRILRDRAMLSLSQGDLGMAEVRLRQSLRRLRPVRKLRLSLIAEAVCVALSTTSYTCLGRRIENDIAWALPAETTHTEYFVSEGFIARLLYLQSQHDPIWSWRRHKKRRRARKIFRRSNRELYGIQPYELNNRVWHFKVEWWWFRLLWAPHTLRLAWKSGDRHRQYQVLLLIVSPLLANYIEKSRKGR